jgi:segregation and condensation protein B
MTSPEIPSDNQQARSSAADSSAHDEQQPDKEVSLDSLTSVYAELLSEQAGPAASDQTAVASQPARPPLQQLEPDVEVSPRAILEAMLFVGHPENQPLMPAQVTRIIRGVSTDELRELVNQLNDLYQQAGAPYTILQQEDGYLLELRPEMLYLREKFYRKVKQQKLSQAAVDVMAIVAYHQGTTREQVDRLRDRSSSAVLLQLVRRQILRVELAEKKQDKPRYYTADRFLSLFGLETLADLPRAHDLEPMN